jgi:hypothetical protein
MRSFTFLIALVGVSALLVAAASPQDCCIGRVGDVNGEGGDEPTIGDIGYMIDALFISGAQFDWYCVPEADVNQSGGPYPTSDDITIGDISELIDYLFITGSQLGLHDCLGEGTPGDWIVNRTTCKSSASISLTDDVPGNQSCVDYVYEAGGKLTLHHINAGFNCCPLDVTARVWLADHTVYIEEEEVLDGWGCWCLCLYDVDIELMVPPGEWRIVFIEPYLESQGPNNDPLDFTVDLSAPTAGRECASRGEYPWEPLANAEGVLVSHTGCKYQSAALADPVPQDQSCIEYEYDGAGILTLNHINALFNCCPTYLTAEFYFQGLEIHVVESENLDGGACDCLCLFDLQLQISNIPAGTYYLVFHELYLSATDPSLSFELDLSEATSGTICVTRTNYP